MKTLPTQQSKVLASPLGFVRALLKLQTYPWVTSILLDLDRPGSIAVRACNGAGKTTRLAVPAALWHACVFPGSLVVVTAGVFRQVKEQFFPELQKYSNLFSDWEFLDTSVNASNGSRILGFSTDEPGNFEGFHNDNLLVIVDEAKSVPDSIFDAIERCQPSRTLLLSSPGGPSGAFYRAFSRDRKHYRQHTVTAYDCPHISKNWIAQQVDKHGTDSHLVRSMIFAEFMENASNVPITLASLERWLENPPSFKSGTKRAFCDFAAGGDENVLAMANGNRIEIVAWRDKDTMRAVGRFIQLFRQYGLEPSRISGDASGLGIPICDRLKEEDWPIRRINNGGTAKDAAYANLGAEIWLTGLREIEKGNFIIPNDPELISQLLSRQVFPNSRGQIALETKEQMRTRGIGSPDRADAVLGCLFAKPAPLFWD